MNDDSIFPVRVLLFAVLRDALKRDEIEVSIPLAGKGSTPFVNDLLTACATQYPLLSPWLPHIRVAVNCEYAAPETPIFEDDEIAFIPPVAGG